MPLLKDLWLAAGISRSPQKKGQALEPSVRAAMSLSLVAREVFGFVLKSRCLNLPVSQNPFTQTATVTFSGFLFLLAAGKFPWQFGDVCGAIPRPWA